MPRLHDVVLFTLPEVAVFQDEQAFKVFRDSPAHLAAGECMSRLSDWAVAYWTE